MHLLLLINKHVFDVVLNKLYLLTELFLDHVIGIHGLQDLDLHCQFARPLPFFGMDLLCGLDRLIRIFS